MVARHPTSMNVIDWLLDSDPSVRWQVMRDLTDAPAHEITAERARVATEGAGARLLALQADNGQWGGAAWNRGCCYNPHRSSAAPNWGLRSSTGVPSTASRFRTRIRVSRMSTTRTQ